MAPAPTESRIFATRYSREAKRLEQMHAQQLAPGTKTWGRAMRSIFERMKQCQSPTKQVAILRAAAQYLKDTTGNSQMHFILARYFTRRSAAMSFATINFDKHPLVGVGAEDGVHVHEHIVYCRRNGEATTRLYGSLAYISRHAVERLHERTNAMTIEDATGIFSYIGILGYMAGHSDKHVDAGLGLLLDGDIIAVGALREAVGGSTKALCRFFEVRTFLPGDDVRENNPGLFAKAKQTMEILDVWVKDQEKDLDNATKLAETVPVIPTREDYSKRTATMFSKAQLKERAQEMP